MKWKNVYILIPKIKKKKIFFLIKKNNFLK